MEPKWVCFYSNPALNAELIPEAMCVKACNEEAFWRLHIHTKHTYYYQIHVFFVLKFTEWTENVGQEGMRCEFTAIAWKCVLSSF